VIAAGLDFELPAALAAREPVEARGGRRDDVRLLLGRRGTGAVSHHRFRDLPGLLEPGDLLVVNNSATLPAALEGRPPGGAPVRLHVSAELADGSWVVEPRRPAGGSSSPYDPADTPARPGWRVAVPEGTVTFLRPYTTRLWVAHAAVPGGRVAYLHRHGRPIRYDYTDRDWPLAAYQTVFATEPGSAEMPSAGRPFTRETLAGLATRGVLVAPVTLHTGVASPEASEKPYPEPYAVPECTARLVAGTRAGGGRVVAVGTTVVRALESAAAGGRLRAAAGWTDLVIGPGYPLAAVDGLLTGLHEPRASHLLMLTAVAGEPLLRASYAEALRARYRWHEFGDVHLLLP
jgi:S-adenosylmethionine:tRNA ribosyltransferase-isomerase